MIPIPGVVIALLTFPGVIVHEAAHLLFCRLAGLAVFDVCYFRVGNPAGFVVHEPPGSYRASFAVSMGPFVVNSILCVLFCSAGLLPVWELELRDPAAYCRCPRRSAGSCGPAGTRVRATPPGRR